MAQLHLLAQDDQNEMQQHDTMKIYIYTCISAHIHVYVCADINVVKCNYFC